jgi:low affinity Fe/Cu permease
MNNHKNKVDIFNDKVANKITQIVGTMWCAYIFCILALISLPSTIENTLQTKNLMPLVSWTAQTFLQLVLLAVIQKGQNIGSDKLDKTIAKIEENTEITKRICEAIEKSEEKELGEIQEIEEKESLVSSNN